MTTPLAREYHQRHVEARTRMQLAGAASTINDLRMRQLSMRAEIASAEQELAGIRREIALEQARLTELRNGMRLGRLGKGPAAQPVEADLGQDVKHHKDAVLRAVADAHVVKVVDIVDSGRATKVVAARCHAASLLRVGRSTSEVGRILNRDHSTILHSYTRWEQIRHLYTSEIATVYEALGRTDQRFLGNIDA